MDTKFTIYPAIDIREGRAVRLVHGAADQETRYFEDPLDAAKLWQDAGSEVLHVVDLDGAFEGAPQNLGVIEKMVGLGLRVQMGGGLRTTEAVRSAIEAGCVRAIVGTRAAKDPEWVAELVERFGSTIVAGIDSRNGRVAVAGWVDTTETTTEDLAQRLVGVGVETIIHTDIDTDGTLGGPNIPAQETLLRSVPVKVIASGGVSGPEDIMELRALGDEFPGLDGVIVGKALYEGRVDLRSLLGVLAEDGSA